MRSVILNNNKIIYCQHRHSIRPCLVAQSVMSDRSPRACCGFVTFYRCQKYPRTLFQVLKYTVTYKELLILVKKTKEERWMCPYYVTKIMLERLWNHKTKTIPEDLDIEGKALKANCYKQFSINCQYWIPSILSN